MTKVYFISLVAMVIGLTIIGFSSDWWVAFGLFLFICGNNGDRWIFYKKRFISLKDLENLESKNENEQ